MTQQQVKKLLISTVTVSSPTRSLLLTGEWGVGKSFVLDQVLSTHATHTMICVSLYGKESISEVYNELLFKLLRLNNESVLSGLATGVDFLGKLRPEVTQRFERILTDAQSHFALESLSPTIIVVLDDFERISENLSVVKVGGLIEKLRARCWVVTVANVKEIRERSIFSRYSERLFDKELSIDSIPESIIHHILASSGNLLLPPRTYDLMRSLVLEQGILNLRLVKRFARSVEDFLVLSDMASLEVVEHETFLRLFLGLTVHLYGENGSIADLRKEMYSVDRDNYLSQFCRKYKVQRSYGFNFEPFFSFFESRTIIIGAMLNTLGIESLDEIDRSFVRLTNWQCHSLAVVKAAIKSIIATISSEQILRFSIYDLYSIFHSIFCFSREVGAGFRYANFRRLLLSRLEYLCSHYSDRTIEDEVRRIERSSPQSDFSPEMDLFLSIAGKMRTIQESDQLFKEFTEAILNERFYAAFSLGSKDRFPLDRINSVLSVLLSDQVPMDFFYALESELRTGSSLFSQHVKEWAASEAAQITDIVIKSRIERLVGRSATS